MKNLLSLPSLVLSVGVLCTTFSALAQVNVTGLWTGSSIAGGNSYANTFILQQTGTQVTGSQTAGSNATCTITGNVDGDVLTMFSTCPTINYSSNSTATTDGRTMSGTFSDSQGTTGTFTATNNSPPATPTVTPTPAVLQPGTVPTVPVVTVTGKAATFTLQKFSGISLKKLKLLLGRAKAGKAPNLTAQYQVDIKGSEKRKLTSKKNVLAAKNLKPGDYSATYKVTVFKDGVKAYSSKPSAGAKFSIAK